MAYTICILSDKIATPHKKRIAVGYAPAAICFFIRLPYYDWAI